MDMKPEIKNQFKAVEKQYLNAIKSYVIDYDIKIEIIDVAENRRKRFKDINHEFLPSFSIRITTLSDMYGKQLYFNLNDGTNVDGMHYNSLTFSIDNLKNVRGMSFRIQDYFTHNEIAQKIEDYFDASDPKQASAKITRFIEQIIFLMEQDDIKHIISSEDWIKVPNDKSMYF